MKPSPRNGLPLILLAGLAFLVESLQAADWPQFRGATRDGRSVERGLLTEWPKTGPEKLWDVSLGGGYSGIAVAENRVFTLSAEADGETLIALDADTGRELWRYRTDRNRGDRQGSGPRSTPTVADGTVYAIFAYGKLHAVDAASGEMRWTVDLVRELRASVPRWGYSSSPLHHQGRLLVETGGGKGEAVASLDGETGEVRWQSGDDTAGYSSPQVVDLAGLPQLITFGGTAVSSMKPWTGRTFWTVPWNTRYGVNAAMPVFVSPELLFVASGYGVGGMMLRVQIVDGLMTINEMSSLVRGGSRLKRAAAAVMRGVELQRMRSPIVARVSRAKLERWAARRGTRSDPRRTVQ